MQLLIKHFIQILYCFILFLSLSGVQGHEASWLPCTFSDEREIKKSDNVTELEFISREAILQFGKEGDAPVNPHVITFLVTGKTLAMRGCRWKNLVSHHLLFLPPPHTRI